MLHPLSVTIIENQAHKSNKRIADAANDPTLDISQIAGEENRKMFTLLQRVDAMVEAFVESSTDSARNAGHTMFEKAKGHVKPEYIPYLAEGVSELVSRVRQGAEQGHPLPMNYMDPKVRKEIFLVESYMRAAVDETAE